MAFELVDRVWDPDARDNADWFGVGTDTILLLDGAAPRAAPAVSSFANDTVWFVRRFVEVYGPAGLALDTAEALEQIERCRAQLDGEYRAMCRQSDLTPSETPFSCLAVARDHADCIELINMGDLTTLIRTSDGVRRFGSSTVRDLDAQAIELLRAELERGVVPHAARVANVWPRLEAHRALRNVLPGYDVLDVNFCATGHAERLVCARHSVQACMLMSDGFYRLVDTFGLYDDDSLFLAAERNGLGALLEELRAAEASDAQCVRNPRFKPSDDATALLFKCSAPRRARVMAP